MNIRFPGLWHHPEFLKLWSGQTISEIGSRITREGLPLTAILILAATPTQVGILAAAAALPVILFGLFAGVWVDRLPRRPILILADVGRLLVLLTIPLAAVTHNLSFGLLLVVAFVTGLLTLFFDTAYQSILPSLVSPENILEGNTKLATTQSLAEIGGPALAGSLIQLLSAPLAILVDAGSFLVSVISLLLIRSPENPPAVADRVSIAAEMRAGIRAISERPALRTMAIGAGLRSFFGMFYAALYSVFTLRIVGMTPASEGVLISMGGIGALIGALLAERLVRRFGLGRVLIGAQLIGVPFSLLTPLASGTPIAAFGMLAAAQLVGDGAAMIYAINTLTYRQSSVPDHLLGRVNATAGFIEQSIMPLGALIGGWLGDQIGARAALGIAASGFVVSALWMAASPIRKLR